MSIALDRAARALRRVSRDAEKWELRLEDRSGQQFFVQIVAENQREAIRKSREMGRFVGVVGRVYDGRDGLSKKTIAKEAVRQLNGIYDLLKENNFNGASANLHSNSANRYMASIIAGGEQLPEWLNRNKGYLQAHGWRWYG